MSATFHAITAKQELQIKVFNLITERMKVLRLYTQDLTVQRINFLNPNYYSLITEHTSITMGCNFNISDRELATIIDLTEVTDKNEPFLDHSRFRCYIRSFTIKYELMHKLALKWQKQGLFTSIVDLWLSHLQRHPGRDFRYRYIGQRASNGSNRHTSFLSSRLHGFIKRFFDSLKEITGSDIWWKNYRYFYVNPFNPSSPGYNIYDQKALNEHEQMLISFFGIDNLLNVQTGGTQASYDPGQEAFTNYLQLPTRPNFFRTYRALNHVNPADVQRAFGEWIALVAAGGNAVSSRPALTDKQLELIYNQARPKYALGAGYTVLVCISNRVSIKAFENNSYFFDDEDCQSGAVFCNHLARLEAWQDGIVSFNSKPYKDVFPFLDITPWTTQGSEIQVLQEGAQQINVYMRSILPLVTVSISDSATKFCFSSFIHPFGSTRYKSFVNDVVGVPKRVYINDMRLIHDKTVKEMPQDHSTIVIPHIHPGIDRHTPRDNTGVRPIIDLTWQITLFIAQMAMNDPFLPREQKMDILANQCLPHSPQLDGTLRILYTRLNQAKKEYEIFEQEKNAENHRVVRNASRSASTTTSKK